MNLSGRLSIALMNGPPLPETRAITRPPSIADTASCARSIAREEESPHDSEANRHSGELMVQERAGEAAIARRNGSAISGNVIGHARF